MANRYGRGFREDAGSFEHRGPEQQGDVHEVQASVAKTHFSQLLDEVERGATIVVLRHGRPIARIVPDPDGQRQRKLRAIENIRRLGKQIRKETGGATTAEIVSWIHEGHRI
jgi:prevent-host-death family protein